MSEQAIVERIISDAEEEARKIVEAAEQKAAEAVEKAGELADRNRRGTEAEAAAKAKSILDGKAASARLDGAKITLGEKRRVIDEVYNRALKQLNALDREQTLSLAERLLSDYAENGDEIVFAENFRFAQDIASLGVVKQKNLKVSSSRKNIDGGFILCGKYSDKNLSYGALLAADREERQAEIAAQLFND